MDVASAREMTPSAKASSVKFFREETSAAVALASCCAVAAACAGRLIDLFDVELLLELSCLGVVELALLPACLRGECHADAVVSDHSEQLAPGVQQHLLVQAADHTLQVDIIQIGRIARHLDPEDGEVRKVAELRGDIPGRELPVADIAKIALVGARRVARAPPGGIRERAVGYEGH